ncbi:Nn.00g059880.m01.CDS01 [Neocucurbitaria sp. VM-36]
MPGMLTRSRSLRFLKSNRKEEEHENSMPPPNAPQTDFDRFNSATPSSRAEESLRTADMLIRPSTSGGPGDRTSVFYKKETNLVPSVYSQDHVLAFPSPTKSTTVLYTAEVTEEQGIIGIALGSPTVGSHWNSTPQASSFKLDSQAEDAQMAHLQHLNDLSQSVSGHRELPRPKISRWKSLFRKAAPPPQDKPSFYQLAQSVTAAPGIDSPHDNQTLESHARPKQEKGSSRTASPPTYKPDIRASRKAGTEEFIAPRSPPEPPMKRGRAVTLGVAAFNPRSTTLQRATTTPQPTTGPKTGEAPGLPQVVVSRSTSDTPVATSEGGPLLDVSIPDIKMERYSVMFGSLLQSSSNRSSSLLARRQGNAEKIKPLNGLSVKEDEQESPMDYKLQRRATSPTVPSPSPRLSLFPPTNPGRAPSPRSTSTNRAVRALQRSRTAPAKSPLRQTFAHDIEDKTNGFGSAPLKPTASPTLQPAITPTSVQSFESDAESITIVVAHTVPAGHSQSQPLKVQLDEREPEWEICSKPKPLAISKREPTASPTMVTTATQLARTDSQRQPKVTKMSALSSHPSSAPLDAPSPLQRLQSLATPPLSASRADVALRSEQRTTSETRGNGETLSKAMVGVARSVSVSKANSPRALVRTMTDTTSPNSERLVERQALTPTMVEVRNRRSQRVQLVDA